ncbi:MAG: DUF1573 domain-containing protein [Candidatus Zixiibacteriota bacterium]
MLLIALGRVGNVSAESKGPRVGVNGETFDFGEVPQKATVSHVFWLKNVGDEVLVIEKMVPNCGCTQAPLETNKANPGDSIRVEMIFASGYFDGVVTKFTQVVSNSTGRAPALTFTATVVPDSLRSGSLRAEPPLVDLDRDRPVLVDSVWTSRVALRNHGSEPVQLSLLDSPDRDVTVEMTGQSLAPGDSHELIFRFPRDLQDRVFAKSVTLEVTGSQSSRLTVPVAKNLRWGPRTLSAEGS